MSQNGVNNNAGADKETADDDFHIENYNGKVKVLMCNDNIRALQTVVRDLSSTRNDFVFYADRLIRLLVEEGLNQIPHVDYPIVTPQGYTYQGIQFQENYCGVSIVRSGESMEKGLRDCCRSISIGKILISSDDTGEARVFYAKFPPAIDEHTILLMYPVFKSGNKVIEAVKVLKDHAVTEEHIILLNLFTTPSALKALMSRFPGVTVLTSEIHPIAPSHFGDKYFGTN